MVTVDFTNPYVAGLLAVALFDLGMAGYAVSRREQQGARPVALLLSGAAIWAASYAVRLSTTDAWEATLALAASMTAANMLAVGVLGFGVEYTGRRQLVTRRRMHAARAVSVLAFLAGATNPRHGLLWTLRGVEVRAGLAIWTVAWQPAAVVYVVWLVGVGAAGIGLILQLVRQTGGLYRRQVLPFAVALLVLLTADAASVLGLVPVAGLWLTPYATGLAAVAFAAGALRLELFERSPVAPSRAHDVAVEALSTPVVVVDGDGVLVHHNPAAGELFAEEDHLGDPLGAHLPALAERLGEADEGFEDDLTEEAAGRRRHLAVRATPADPGWVVSVLDVTDRVLREQRMAVLYRLLRHNVRNETSVVLGNAEALADHDDPDVAEAGAAILEAAETLSDVSEEANRMRRLLEANAEPEAIDAAAAVRELAAEAREDHPGTTVELSAPERAMTRCHVSVRDAVAELVENAIRHHDRDDPRVEVTVEDGDDWVTVAVADDGPGIPEAELAAIREGRETQLVHTSGVGLWLVSWTTTASGGRVRFAENDPRGTVVSLELPAA